jgi:hypothetical protein
LPTAALDPSAAKVRLVKRSFTRRRQLLPAG